MRVLFSTGSSAAYMAPPVLGDEQVNCGPDWQDRAIDGYVTSLATPVGAYDLAAIAAKLPPEQQPDVVVCLVDASWRSTPRNLAAFKCPKVLLVADTHHLNRPIAGMIDYARSEPFDRLVLLYTRHHWEFFTAAGFKNLFWFPGLTFPHSDAVVAKARSIERQRQIAFVGQTGICHPRRIEMLSRLQSKQLPLALKEAQQREALAHYGSSLVGFNSSLNGDLNLRTFEIMASGAALLTDELSVESGLGELWQPGRELITYATPIELGARGREAIEGVAETAKIGEAGARWFDTHFNEKARRQMFAKIAIDGLASPLFPAPESARSETVSITRWGRWTAAYEYVQELHRNLETVTMAVDDTVPLDFVQMCGTLPRIKVIARLPERGTRVDFVACGQANKEEPCLLGATHVWCWDSSEQDKATLARNFAKLGLTPVAGSDGFFRRQMTNTHTNSGSKARVFLERGEYEAAFAYAQLDLKQNPQSVDAMLVIVELALEAGKDVLAADYLRRLSASVPHHPRVVELSRSLSEGNKRKRLLPTRQLRLGKAQFESHLFNDALKSANAALKSDPHSAEAHLLLGKVLVAAGNAAKGAEVLGLATQFAPHKADHWYELGLARFQQGRHADALSALLVAVELSPFESEYQLSLGAAALHAGHGAIAKESFSAVLAAHPEHCFAKREMIKADALCRNTQSPSAKTLLLSHVEVTRLQGTGVLIQRFFPDSSAFITVRSRTLYNATVEFGGLHFSMDLPGVSDDLRAKVLARLLAGFRIDRILAVPYFASDFVHALAAKKATGAPLCTYAMDDQSIHSNAVPRELAQQVFDASSLRLAISPEMVNAYENAFGKTFGLLPPIVTNRDNEVPNSWSPARRDARQCVMVGNIWSAKQFEQLREFVRGAGLKVDWFGNANVSWLPQDKAALEADGIFARGFLPESELAARLAEYSFVLVPSGTLDGTEDNEWLTRLSLPSRMVFILTKTLTPMLVLGHADTAAARFVNQLGLGISSNYDPPEVVERIADFATAEIRADIRENARMAARCFLMPDAGKWILDALQAGVTQTTPFDRIYNTTDGWSGPELKSSALLAKADAA